MADERASGRAEEGPAQDDAEARDPTAGGDAPEDGLSEDASEPEGRAKRAADRKEGWVVRYLGVLLLVAGLVELMVFGHRGHIRVCVAREGEHDWSVLGEPRTKHNTRRYPTCETRLNIGLESHYDERVEHAMIRACHRATILRSKRATLACATRRDGWEHRVEADWVPPWHRDYYSRLFWFVD